MSATSPPKMTIVARVTASRTCRGWRFCGTMNRTLETSLDAGEHGVSAVAETRLVRAAALPMVLGEHRPALAQLPLQSQRGVVIVRDPRRLFDAGFRLIEITH